MKLYHLFFIACLSVPAFAQNTKFWGEHGNGITDSIPNTDPTKILYLTLDACDKRENGFDSDLIKFLNDEKIPATLFWNKNWIIANTDTAAELAKNPLFQIENHGTKHCPASISGRSAYNITGSQNADELIADINDNSDFIEKLTGRKPKWFRAGTAFYDVGAISAILENKYKIAGFRINADDGATLSEKQVYKRVMQSQSGNIIIGHMNRPEGNTAGGLRRALIELRSNGFVFQHLPQK